MDPANQQWGLQMNNSTLSQNISFWRYRILKPVASSGWAELLLQTETRGAMSITAAARKQLYSQKVRRQEGAGLTLSWQ